MAYPLSHYTGMTGTAMEDSWRWTCRLLFKNFTFRRWLTFAFTAWLATLGQGGSFSFNIPQFPGEGGAPRAPMQGMFAWIQQHLTLVVVLAAVGFILLLAFRVLLLWLSSRGKFIFLADVVSDNPVVSDPWHRYRAAAWSLFLWRLCFNIAVFVVMLLLIGGLGGIAFLLREQVPLMLAIIVVGVLLVIVAALAAGIVSSFLQDFVIPLMYRYDQTAVETWRYFLDLLRLHVSGFVIYLLIRFGLTLAAAIVIMGIVVAVGLMTCCVGYIVMMIPILGGLVTSVITLPAPVFFRTFSVRFLEQFHPDYKILQDAAEIPEA